MSAGNCLSRNQRAIEKEKPVSVTWQKSCDPIGSICSLPYFFWLKQSKNNILFTLSAFLPCTSLLLPFSTLYSSCSILYSFLFESCLRYSYDAFSTWFPFFHCCLCNILLSSLLIRDAFVYLCVISSYSLCITSSSPRNGLTSVLYVMPFFLDPLFDSYFFWLRCTGNTSFTLVLAAPCFKLSTSLYDLFRSKRGAYLNKYGMWHQTTFLFENHKTRIKPIPLKRFWHWVFFVTLNLCLKRKQRVRIGLDVDLRKELNIRSKKKNSPNCFWIFSWINIYQETLLSCFSKQNWNEAVPVNTHWDTEFQIFYSSLGQAA